MVKAFTWRGEPTRQFWIALKSATKPEAIRQACNSAPLSDPTSAANAYIHLLELASKAKIESKVPIPGEVIPVFGPAIVFAENLHLNVKNTIHPGLNHLRWPAKVYHEKLCPKVVKDHNILANLFNGIGEALTKMDVAKTSENAVNTAKNVNTTLAELNKTIATITNLMSKAQRGIGAR